MDIVKPIEMVTIKTEGNNITFKDKDNEITLIDRDCDLIIDYSSSEGTYFTKYIKNLINDQLSTTVDIYHKNDFPLVLVSSIGVIGRQYLFIFPLKFDLKVTLDSVPNDHISICV